MVAIGGGLTTVVTMLLALSDELGQLRLLRNASSCELTPQQIEALSAVVALHSRTQPLHT